MGASCFISVFTSTIGTNADGQGTQKLLSYHFPGPLYLRRSWQDHDDSDEVLGTDSLLDSTEACWGSQEGCTGEQRAKIKEGLGGPDRYISTGRPLGDRCQSDNLQAFSGGSGDFGIK